MPCSHSPRTRWGLPLLLPVLFLLGCDGTPSEPGLPAAVTIGDAEGLPDPLFPGQPETLRMAIFDGAGVPIAGAPFSVLTTGSVTPDGGVTDSTGRAEVAWTASEVGGAEVTVISGEASRTVFRTVEMRRVDEITVIGPEKVLAGEPALFTGSVLDQRGGGYEGVAVSPVEGGAATTSGADGAFGGLELTAPETVGEWSPRFVAEGIEAEVRVEVGPGAPSEIELLAGANPVFFVGEAVELAFRIVDGFGNGIPGLEVTAAVDRGSLASSAGVTSEAGEVAFGPWETPGTPGIAVFEVHAGPVHRFLEVEVEVGIEIASLFVVQGSDPHAMRGGRVRVETVVEARDGSGAPVPEAPVDVTITEGRFTESDLPEARLRTDSSGRIVLPEWRVATDAVSPRVRFRALQGEAVVEVGADTQPGNLQLRRVSGNGQNGETRGTLGTPLRVRVEDPKGRPVWDVPVRFSPEEDGHGSFDPEAGTTDREGVMETLWTLGTAVGPVRAVVEVEGGPDVRFDASAEAALAWIIQGVTVGQAVQDLEGSVPLHAGRNAVVQAFIRWTPRAPAQKMPEQVVVEILAGGQVAQSIEMTRPEFFTTAPGSLLDWDASRIARAVIPGHLVQPGMALRVRIDPDGLETDDLDRDLWPQEAAFVPEVIGSPSPLRIRLVPVAEIGTGRAGDVEGREDEFTDLLVAMMDREGVDVTVAEPFEWDGDPVRMDDADSWIAALTALGEARVASGESERFWYGVVDPIGSSGIAGIGYIGYPAAMGWDRQGVGTILAHEVGHNMGRRHAPCGNPGGVDPGYPVPNGRIGAWGLDQGRGLTFGPDSGDIMSYCYAWISAYTRLGFESGLQTLFPSGAAAASTPPIESVRIWGYRSGDRWTLAPAYRLEGALPSRAKGDERLVAVGVHDDGGVLFRIPLVRSAVSHEDGESFSASVPASDFEGIRTLRIELAGAGVVASRTRPETAPSISIEADGALRWTGGPGVTLRRDSQGNVTGLYTSPVVPAGRGALEVHDGFGGQARVGPAERPMGRIEFRR